MMKKLLTIFLAMTACAGVVSATDYPSGLPGLFSINAHGGKVRFSQGNLQFLASVGTTAHPDGTTSAGTWRFAQNQYDGVGSKNQYISETNSDWIDLFGWGTSGYDNTANDPCALNFMPYASSYASTDCDDTNSTGYGPSTDQAYRGLTGASAYYDWGVYNAISNSDADVAWRTLTYAEWYYLLFGRPNAANLRSQATIPNIHGYVLLPDDWELPEGMSFEPRANDWETNTYTVSQWRVMEQAGAVFLPATGERGGTSGRYVNSHGLYWSASAFNPGRAQVIHFEDTTLYSNSRYHRYYGHAVRLVSDVDKQSDPLAKFEGFDVRGSRMGDWIYNNGGFQNIANLTINETDTVLHKYNLILAVGGKEASFTLGGVRFSYTNSGANKSAFTTNAGDIRPGGKDRKIIIPTYPGDDILVAVADTVDYPGMKVQGLASATVDLKAGENILHATADSIVITSSNVSGSEVKPKIGAILCIAHNIREGLSDLEAPHKAEKVLRNGQILILRSGMTYTLQGQEIIVP